MSDAEGDENLCDSDQEVSKNHSKLIEAVTRLDKTQRVKKAERSEPSLEVSEYHLVKSGVTDEDAICVRDLIKSLERKGDQSNIVKKLRYLQQKNKVLPKPLEKPAAERIKRTVGYDKVKDELQKWDSVVTRNRTAEQLSFPLKRVDPVVDSHNSKIPAFLRGFSTKSDLMKKFEEVDPTLLHPPDKEEEKGNKYKMTLEEITLRRKEAARLRAQQSYQEAKAHRLRKIKSKKFHRILRKDKIKQQLKDFEKLKDSNPEEALAKLEQLDKTRAEERMSLRHKNTGQWARNKQIKAKYNKETRQVLAEQLAISKELTQKVKRIDSDEEEEDEEDEGNMEDVEDKEYKKASEERNELSNKSSNVKTEPEIDEFLKLCRSYYDKKQQTNGKQIEKNGTLDEIIPEEEIETSCDRDEKSDTSQADTKNKLGSVEKNSTLRANTNTKSKLRDNQKSSASQKNTGNTKSKLCDNEEGDASRANVNDAKSESCSNKKSNISLTNTDEMKDKIPKGKKNKGKTKNKESPVDVCEESKQHSDCKDNKKSASQGIKKTSNSKGPKKENTKRKLNQQVQKVKKKFKANKTEKAEEVEEETEDYSPSLEFEDPKRKPILDSPLDETTSGENARKDSDLTRLKAIANSVQEPAGTGHEMEIDPKKYVNIKPKHLKTQLPDVATYGDEDSEQEEETHRIMSEAFADDDVVEEFRKEKEEEMEKSQPQNIDLSLPGWGSWGGSNIKKSKVARKKSRFILTVPKEKPRKPENQGKVIVFEHENEKLKKHLVRELPYPFTRVKDFEATIRAPISRTFVPMNAHMRLIQPAVKTKLGQVIEPMDESKLVKKESMMKIPLKRNNAKNDNKRKNDKKNDKKNAVKKTIAKRNNKKRRNQNVQNKNTK